MTILQELTVKLGFDDKRYQRGTKNLDKTLNRLEKTVLRVGAAFLAAFAARKVIQGIRAIVGGAMDFEVALVGVGKTTDLMGKKLASLGDWIGRLSIRLATGSGALLEIAQAAGQLGVKGARNILTFTETVAKLGKTTDLKGDAAATTLARMLNVTKELISEAPRLGAVIVALGNNFAATESEIADSGGAVARATAQFNLGAAASSALGVAMASLGVQSRLGASVIGKAFRTIQLAVLEGGDALAQLERITGQTGATLQETFGRDPAAVFLMFLDGLARAGERASIEMRDFGLTGDEVNKVLPILAQRTDILRRALEIANREWEEATALNEEFQRSLETSTSKVDKMKSAFSELAREIGERAMPLVNRFAVGMTRMIEGLLSLFPVVAEGASEVLLAGFKVLDIQDKIAKLEKEIAESAGDATGRRLVLEQLLIDAKAELAKALATEAELLAEVRTEVSAAAAGVERYADGLDGLKAKVDAITAEKYATALGLKELDQADKKWKALLAAQERAGAELGTIISRHTVYQNSLIDAAAAQDELSASGRRMGSAVSSALGRIGDKAESITDKLRRLAVSIADISIQSAFIDPFAKSASSFLSKLLIPGAAHGGTVQPGQPITVGERGRELFVPNAPGKIVPHGALPKGGRSGPNFFVDMRGASLEAVQRLERIVMAVHGSIEPRAVAAVADAAARRP